MGHHRSVCDLFIREGDLTGLFAREATTLRAVLGQVYTWGRDSLDIDTLRYVDTEGELRLPCVCVCVFYVV